MRSGSSVDYLTLKTESASLLKLFLFTLSYKFVDIRKLVDCPPGKENSYTSFGDRWIIVSSILLQKFLLSIANHLKMFKSMQGIYLFYNLKPTLTTSTHLCFHLHFSPTYVLDKQFKL